MTKLDIALSSLKKILIITVHEGKDKPYQCGDGYFLRMGSNSQKMDRNRLIEFLQSEGKLRFEEQYHPRFDYQKNYDTGKLTRGCTRAEVLRCKRRCKVMAVTL